MTYDVVTETCWRKHTLVASLFLISERERRFDWLRRVKVSEGLDAVVFNATLLLTSFPNHNCSFCCSVNLRGFRPDSCRALAIVGQDFKLDLQDFTARPGFINFSGKVFTCA